MNNSVFEKNINALKARGFGVAEKLLKHVLSDVPEFVKENNFYNFKYKGNYYTIL